MANRTIQQIAELVHRQLDGSDIAPTSRFHYEEVLLTVQSVYASVLSSRARQSDNAGIVEIDGKIILTLTNQIPVLDTSRNEYKLSITESWVTLPNGHGMFQISPMKDQKEVYVPMQNGTLGLMAGLDIACLEGQIGYYVENNNVYFVNGTKTAERKLLVKIISSSEESVVSDELSAMVIDSSYEILKKRLPADNINDNTARLERETKIKQ